MAKETTIIFVYDTQMLQREEDDPANAILYFHPTWVSDQQKTALCGQIMGTITCIKNLFSLPKIVCLQSGKFFLIENGRYILAVGTDRNISDSLLEHRANILYSLVNFFHRDFEALSELYQHETLSAKLYHIFETYLKMLFLSGNIFSHISSLNLPKSASNVFTEAICVLESCREYSNVLGGTILYHNKVVATQLTSDLTKRIVMSDPYRIKCPAELGEVAFNLPLGVQLLQVYITNKDFCALLETSLRNRCIFQYLNNKSIKKPHQNKQTVQDTPLISSMKRDQSLLFTTVPEEDDPDNVSVTSSNASLAQISVSKKPRPKFLNLKSLSIDEQNNSPTTTNTTTPFCGQTSVASTPLNDLKKFVYQKPLSLVTRDNDINEKDELLVPNTNNISDTATKKYHSIQTMFYDTRKYSSLTDLNSIVKNPEQYSRLKTKIDLDISPKTLRNFSKSLTDPLFPIFKPDGTSISHSFYQASVKMTADEYFDSIIGKTQITNVINSNETKVIDIAKKSHTVKPKPLLKSLDLSNKHTRDRRKSLNLPLKSLSIEENNIKSENLTRRFSSGVQLTPLMSKLSMLAFEQSTPSNIAGTPCIATPTTSRLAKFKTRKEEEVNEARFENEMALQKCILFVCGQQDVVLALLLKEECCKDQDTIEKLWEISTEHLGRLEKQLSFCMESQSGATSTSSQDAEPYSFLCLDHEWDAVKRAGPWDANDVTALTTLHNDFEEHNDLTEILLRGNDSIVYGHHCGPSEIYYHESAGPTSGLPPPSDPMGLVQLKAKRRLERDQAVILL